MTQSPKPRTPLVARDYLVKQAMEISDMAREHRDFDTALNALDFIAQLQGMHDPDRI